MKQCKKCNQLKQLDDFPKQKANADGRLGICRECNKVRTNKNSEVFRSKNSERLKLAQQERKLLNPDERKEYDRKYKETHGAELIDQKTRWNCKEIYKISFELYKERMDTSDRCEICEKKEDLCYDHDHNTLHFRGVLCRGCNRSIGQLGDTKESIEKVLEYFNK